jgi:ABC-type Mn2+/Zn2+ transport system permease subunit
VNEIAAVFSDPWQLEFMRRGAATLVMIVAGVVMARILSMAFISDALPHASFGGGDAFALGGSLYLGGAIAALTTALLRFHRPPRSRQV